MRTAKDKTDISHLCPGSVGYAGDDSLYHAREAHASYRRALDEFVEHRVHEHRDCGASEGEIRDWL